MKHTVSIVCLLTVTGIVTACGGSAPPEAPAAAAPTTAAVQPAADEHARHTPAQSASEHVHPVHPKLELDPQGKRWATDEPLRTGMGRIRDAVAPHVGPGVQPMSAAQAQALASTVRDQVQYLIENCKLDPQADATLHAVIGDLLSGAKGLEADPAAMDGLPLIVEALNQYPKYFEHPAWQPVG